MKIIWTKEAAQDRADIWDYLHAVNPKAAIEGCPIQRRDNPAGPPP
jgi:hypothetical protein